MSESMNVSLKDQIEINNLYIEITLDMCQEHLEHIQNDPSLPRDQDVHDQETDPVLQ